jgi:hypothetical protein
MDLRNMRHLGVRGLAVHCLSQNCRHEVVFSAADYPDEVEVASFQSRMKCNECWGKNVDVRPNWKEQPVQIRERRSLASRFPRSLARSRLRSGYRGHIVVNEFV